ncbi:uncharacterized protein LOC125685307 isoform X1 [Lagopus muta]|uniref:uncharacterized protein LOC125685307 isoform X1 n=1 Tax=Lagopus muta TaxID=64668 RepID=UPI0020A19A10|nr:uncharacterized protein LOC125685307 isoform X1 [Lagopus muta]
MLEEKMLEKERIWSKKRKYWGRRENIGGREKIIEGEEKTLWKKPNFGGGIMEKKRKRRGREEKRREEKRREEKRREEKRREEKRREEKRREEKRRGTDGGEEREDGGSRVGACQGRRAGGGQGGRGGPTAPICRRCPPPAAGMQGMELCAVAVVILLFIAVLKQFGILEPISVEDTSDGDVELSAARHQPEGLEELQAHTKFTKKELQSLYRGFKNDCPSGHVDEETFTLIYAQFFPQGGEPGVHHPPPLKSIAHPPKTAPQKYPDPTGCSLTAPSPDSSAYAHFLFNAFDADGSGALCFEDFVVGLSVLLRGTAQEKLNWAFNLYDINKDGRITKEEMLEIMKSIYDMMGRCTLPAPRDSAPAEHVEQFFQKMDRNGDGVVTYEEFLETCQQDADIMSSMQIFENTI